MYTTIRLQSPVNSHHQPRCHVDEHHQHTDYRFHPHTRQFSISDRGCRVDAACRLWLLNHQVSINPSCCLPPVQKCVTLVAVTIHNCFSIWKASMESHDFCVSKNPAYYLQTTVHCDAIIPSVCGSESGPEITFTSTRIKIGSLTSAVLIRRENVCASTSPIPLSMTSMHHTTPRTITGHRIFPTAFRHHNSPRPANQLLPARRQPSRPKHAKRRLPKTRRRSPYADGMMRLLGKFLDLISIGQL